MTHNEYSALRGVNWSTLKLLSKSPAHYLHNLTEGRPDTDALKRGRAVHVAVFEPESFAARYQVWAGRRQGKEWESFHNAAHLAGMEVLTEKEYEKAKAIALAVRSNPIAAAYVSGGRAEFPLTWTVERPDVDGVPGWRFDAKGRLDLLKDSSVVDLKTTKDGSPSGFAREVVRLEHHAQAAWYCDGVQAVTGTAPDFFWVAVEAEAPYVCTVYRAPEDVLAEGRARYRELLDMLALCRRTNSWPGYATSEMDLSLPRWARPLEEDDVEDLDLVWKE